MREMCVGMLVVCLGGASAAQAPDQRSQVLDERTAEVLGRAREALGVGATALRTFSGSGTGRRSVGPLQLAGRFEMRIAFPDRFVRIDRIGPSGLDAEVASGFNGTSLIQRAIGSNGLRVDPTAAIAPSSRAAATAAALVGAKQDLALLLLGFLAASFEFYPLTFAPAGTAESADGTADVIALTAPNGFAARLFLDTRSGRPLMVSWDGPDVPGAMRTLARGGAPIDPQTLALGPQVEHRLYFSEYGRVGRFTWPFLIRRSIDGQPVEEIRFSTLTADAEIDPRLFAPDR